MTEHLPECPMFKPCCDEDSFPDLCGKPVDRCLHCMAECICDRLRACEARVTRHEDAVKGLGAIIKEYQAMVHALREQGGRLVNQRDRARSVAATLEAECAQCWGPVHAKVIEEVRLGAFYSEGWDDDGA